MDSGKKHTAGFNSHHCSGGKVYDCNESLTYKLLGLIELVDAAEDCTVSTCAVIKGKLEKLLRLLYSLASLYLYCSEIGLRECLEIYALLKERLDNYLREVDNLLLLLLFCLLLLGSIKALECGELP